MRIARNRPLVGWGLTLRAPDGELLDALPRGGTFTLVRQGNSTPPVALSAPAAVIQTALEALPGVGAGNVQCTGGPLATESVVVEWAGDLGGTLLAPLAAQLNAVGGIDPSVFVNITQNGGGGANALFALEVSGAYEGSITLTYAGTPTASIAYNAPASEVQTALETLPGLAGNVQVTGGPLNSAAVSIEFVHGLARTAIAAFELASQLIGDTPSASLTPMQAGAAGINQRETIGLAHGLPIARLVRDGGAAQSLTAAPSGRGDGLWLVNLQAAETDADTIVVSLSAGSGAVHQTFVTETPAPAAAELVAALAAAILAEPAHKLATDAAGRVTLTAGQDGWLAEGLLDHPHAVENGVSLRDYLRRTGAVLCGKLSGAGSGIEIFTGMDGATVRLSGTLDEAGNRTSVVYA